MTSLVRIAPGVELVTTDPIPAAAYPLLAWLADWWTQRKAVTP